MPVFALWSAPRARSTAFFRSMVERGDLLALHEPFWNLLAFGETDVDGRTFDAPASLLAWLRDETHDVNVFLKDTTDHRYGEVLADRRFLAEARHAFLIRRPEEIAASYYALWPDMRIEEVGLEALHELHAAVRDAGGHPPVVIDSDDLVARPEATMAAYCAAVELPFIPRGAHVGAGRTARVATVRPLARGRQCQLRLRAARAHVHAHRRELRRAGAASPPITCRSTSSSTRSGSTSPRGSQRWAPDRRRRRSAARGQVTGGSTQTVAAGPGAAEFGDLAHADRPAAQSTPSQIGDPDLIAAGICQGGLAHRP